MPNKIIDIEITISEEELQELQSGEEFDWNFENPADGYTVNAHIRLEDQRDL